MGRNAAASMASRLRNICGSLISIFTCAPPLACWNLCPISILSFPATLQQHRIARSLHANMCNTLRQPEHSLEWQTEKQEDASDVELVTTKSTRAPMPSLTCFQCANRKESHNSMVLCYKVHVQVDMSLVSPSPRNAHRLPYLGIAPRLTSSRQNSRRFFVAFFLSRRTAYPTPKSLIPFCPHPVYSLLLKSQIPLSS
jgi:hypothetical protein